MGATMVLDGLTHAGQAHKQAAANALANKDAAALADAQRVWRDTPSGPELGALDDAALARRWTATAAWPDQPEATEVRTRLEAELARRDPETMRDYRSWRNSAGATPGDAMRLALAEREARLHQAWAPLLGTGAAAMDGDEVVTRWAAAHAAHGLDAQTAARLDQARAAGQARLAGVDPARLNAWKALQVGTPSTVPGVSRPGLTPAAAAARIAGQQGAFLPTPRPAAKDGAAAEKGGKDQQTGWAAVAATGVAVVRTAARATPAAPAAAAVDGLAASTRAVQHAITRGMHP
jgi:hypothetical protein